MLGPVVSSEGRLSMVMTLQKQKSHQPGHAIAGQNGVVVDAVVLARGRRRRATTNLRTI